METQRLYEGIEKLGNKFDLFASTTSERLTKIETMFDLFEKDRNNLSAKMNEVEKDSTEALQSTKAAHKRLDDTPSKAEFEALKDQVRGHKQIIFWISTLVIGAVVLAVMAQVIQK